MTQNTLVFYDDFPVDKTVRYVSPDPTWGEWGCDEANTHIERRIKERLLAVLTIELHRRHYVLMHSPLPPMNAITRRRLSAHYLWGLFNSR
jgi:hypothetical protein